MGKTGMRLKLIIKKNINKYKGYVILPELGSFWILLLAFGNCTLGAA